MTPLEGNEPEPVTIGQFTPDAARHTQFGFVDANTGDRLTALEMSEREAELATVEITAAHYDDRGLFKGLKYLRIPKEPITAARNFAAEVYEESPRWAKVGAAVTAATFTAAVGTLWVKHRRKG